MMLNRFSRRSFAMLGIGLAMGLLTGVGMLIGSLVGAKHQPPGVAMPSTEILLNATASHSGDSFAMATGQVDEDVEGLFMLDYLTGDLLCWVIYPRYPAAGFSAAFRYNVVGDLGIEQGKKPNYVLVTGGAQFQRGSSGNVPASTIIYVADANSGNVAAYGISWNRTAARGGQPQAGTFTLLAKQKARQLQLRE